MVVKNGDESHGIESVKKHTTQNQVIDEGVFVPQKKGFCRCYLVFDVLTFPSLPVIHAPLM